MSNSHTELERRWRNYIGGEMSRAEAEAFEREHGLKSPPAVAAGHANDTPGPFPVDGVSDTDVRLALLRLDAVEAARRRPILHAWDRVPVWRRRSAWGIGAVLLLAAAAVLVVMFGGIGDDDRGAGPDPRVVAPADAGPASPSEHRLAPATRPESNVANVVRTEATDTVDGDTRPDSDLGPQLAAGEADTSGETQAAARFVDNAVIGARSGTALTVTLATTPLGLGPERRSRLPQLKQPLQRVVVAAAPHMERLVTSGLLDAAITCVDERGRAGRVRLRLDDGPAGPALTVSGAPRELTTCIAQEPFDAAAWAGISGRFVLSIEDSPPPRAKVPPGKGAPER